MTRPFDRIAVRMPKGSDPATTLRMLAEAAARDRDADSGAVRTPDGGEVAWHLQRHGSGAAIDPRQRRAAALLLVAFDLPQDIVASCMSMLEAADVDPSMGLRNMGVDHRRTTLLEVRALVDTMLADATGSPMDPAPLP